MKLAPAIISGITLLACGYSGAATPMPETGATMVLASSTSVGGGIFSSLPTASVFNSGAAQDGVTHMLVGPMAVSPTGVNSYAGSYRMFNASTDKTVSTGIVNFTMGSSDAYVGSRKVVGVIPLTNGWANSTLTLTQHTGALEGVTASVAYNTGISVMQVTVGSSVSYVPYVATNDSTVVFESPFWISSGSTTVKFSGGYAEKQTDGSYLGMMTPSDGSAAYIVQLSDPNDSDGDKVADLTDADNYWYSGCIYYKGAEYSSWLGWFNFYYPPSGSGEWNDYAIGAHSYIWHYEHGLLYTFPRLQDGVVWLYIYDMSLGWLATNENLYPYIYAFDIVLDKVDYGETWLYYKEGSGSSTNRYFFAMTGKMNTSSNMGRVNDGFGGWWSIPGANAQ
jgi:hypothetical protein